MARNILITGSSHGIGAGLAVAFARDEGANIGICGNKSAAGAQEVARQCEAYGVKTKIYLGDVGSHDWCKATMEDFIATFGKIDVLINNAGGALQIPGGPKGEFKDMPMEYWDSQIALNLNAAAYLSRYAVADIRALSLPNWPNDILRKILSPSPTRFRSGAEEPLMKSSP